MDRQLPPAWRQRFRQVVAAAAGHEPVAKALARAVENGDEAAVAEAVLLAVFSIAEGKSHRLFSIAEGKSRRLLRC